MLAFTTSLALLPRSLGTHVSPLTSRRVRVASRPVTRMVLSDKEARSSPVRITGNNITLTDSLRGYVEDKLGKVTGRFGSLLTKVDVHLTVEHNPSIHTNNKAEVVAFAGKTILRAEVRSDDMYSAIDEVEIRIGRIVRKFKERKESKHKTSKGRGSDVANALPKSAAVTDDIVDEDEVEDKYKDVYGTETIQGVPAVTEVVKRKVFPMPLQTVEEAVLCCEYVDHPWYLFRNAETKEVCLVYKRNHGGYGLIEPSNPNGKDEEEVM